PRKPPLPYVPGSDGAGEIEAIGADVRDFSVGDRVYLHGTDGGQLSGTYAELAIAAPHQVHRLPARASFSQGAALGVPYATAYRALFDCARLRPAEIVLVHGATGGVGIAAVQLAHAHGAMVIGSGGTELGLQLVREHGADMAVDHGAADYTSDILRATAG